MGNSSSSGRAQDETVDGGALDIVARLIIARKLAPFYRPLEDYEPDWDESQILAARKQPPQSDDQPQSEPVTPSKSSHGSKRPATAKEVSPAAIYKGAVECPICFLFYPPNINYSRCCDQAICTECFVQIKRSEPTTTHVVSDPAACPYCVQENFGVVYKPPSWRSGIGSDSLTSVFSDSSKTSLPSTTEPPTHKRRQKSYSADSPEVVTTDQIRPDWEAKLAAVKAAVARRANRRIIMRQVGDRLIPVGVTSGRIHALSPEEAAHAEEEGGSSRRSRRRQQGAANGGLEQYMGIAGQDLEELMMMEAMRLSLLEHEEHQRKQAEEEKKKKKDSEQDSSSDPQAPTSESSATTLPSTSTAIPVPSSSSASTDRDAAVHPSNSTPSPNSSRDLSSSLPPPSSTRPYSTLTAALSAASTASAVLTPSPATNSPSLGDEQSPGQSSAQVRDLPASQPQDTASTPRPVPTHQDSTSSSILSTGTTSTTKAYDELPSSPESLVSEHDREPLLASDPAPVPGSGPPSPSTPASHSSD